MFIFLKVTYLISLIVSFIFFRLFLTLCVDFQSDLGTQNVLLCSNTVSVAQALEGKM